MADHDFDRVYRNYFGEVYRFALALCHDPNLADEVTQETFFKALKRINKFRGECRLSTWLCQIAKHTWYDMARKRGHEAPDLPQLQISPEDIEQRLADRDSAIEIHRVLHKLREPYKEVFWLRTFGELQFAQIGVLFDKTESWARVTYHRARLLIREEISADDED